MNQRILASVAQLAVAAIAATLSFALRLLYATWRIDARDLKQLDEVLARADRVLVTFWHGQYLPLLPLMRGRQICIFTSRSFRGHVIEAICKQFGCRCVLIPQGEHDEALRVIEAAMRREPRCATAADGPHGPARRFKSSLVELASDLQFAVVPLWFSATSSYLAKLRWDRREVPRPFARIHLHVGGPIEIPSSLDPEGVEKWCRRLGEEENLLGGAGGIG